MVLPHQIFGYLYEHHPDNFAIRFLGGAGARVYWPQLAVRSTAILAVVGWP